MISHALRSKIKVKSIVCTTFLFLSVFYGVSASASEGSTDFFQDKTLPLVDYLDRNDGISNLSVSSIIQDKFGMLWFGTQDGLNRYDGREIISYKYQPFTENGLPHNLIQTIYYDEESHELWIGTYNGASRFDLASETFDSYTTDDGTESLLSDPVVISIIKDNEGYIWLGTASGLDRLDPKDGKIVNYNVPGKTVRSLLMASNGKLYVGTLEGLMLYDETSDSLKPIELGLKSKYVMTVDEFTEGIITLGVWGQGVVIINNTHEVIDEFSLDESNEVYAMALTKDNTLWVGTWGGGLYAIEKNGVRHHLHSDSSEKTISNDVIYALLEDDSGILWVGTNGGGVNILNPRKRDFLRYFHDVENPNSIDAGKINAIYQDTSGDYWISIYNKGINRIDSEGNVYQRYNLDEENIIGNQVKQIYEDWDGRIIACVDNGLAIYDVASDTFKRWDILPNRNRVYDITQTGKGIFWIGTYDEGLFNYNSDEGRLMPHKISDTKVYRLLNDQQGRLWVGTNNGLNVLLPNESSFKAYKSLNPVPGDLPSNSVENIFEDKRGNIWFATSSGVAYYDEDNDDFIAFTEEDGLTSNGVSALLECEHNTIWVATQNGITLINPETNLLRALTPEQGIGGWEFGGGALLDDEGQIMFGGIHGIVSIPDHISFVSGNTPDVYITDVKLFDDSVVIEETFYNNQDLLFGPDENFITFEFIAIDYDTPKDITYEYRMVGFDDNWYDIGYRNFVSYTNLPADDYTFEVRATTVYGNKTEPAELTIRIKEHWYLSWYAFVLYIIGAFVLVYVFYQIQKAKNINQRNKELDKINSELAAANHQLEELSIKDSLTGLYNRRFFDMKLDDFLHLAKRARTNIAMIMIDLDDFKTINDVYGHVQGDKFLSALGKILEDNLHRSIDFACRYGGDEFILLLYDSSIDGTVMVAEKILEQVRNKIIIDGLMIEEIKGTASIGIISAIPEVETTSESYLKAVDQALYRAKDKGKNCISIGKLE